MVFAAASVLLSFLTSGCVLNRVYAVRDQLCHDPGAIALRVDDTVQMSMHEPVLRDTDVTWLAGAEPDERSAVGDRLEMRYVVHKHQASSDPRFDIPVDLSFRLIDGNYLLEQGRINMDLRAVVDAISLEDASRQGCDAQPNMLRQRMEVDLSGFDRSKLPDRDAILEILGPPLNGSPSGDMLVYEYRLQGASADSAAESARAVTWYDPTSGELLRVKLRYRFYELDADFQAEKALVKVIL